MNEVHNNSVPESKTRQKKAASTWIIAIVMFLIPLMGWSIMQLRMHNDVTGWLPQDDPQARLLAWYQDMFPSEDRILVSWDGCAITDRRLSELNSELLGRSGPDGERQGGSPYVKNVALPSDVIQQMMKRGITFENAISQIDGLLIGKGPLRIRLTDVGRSRGEYMQQEILQLLSKEFSIDATFVELAMPVPPEWEETSADDSSLAARVNDELQDFVLSQPLYDLQLDWPEMRSDRTTLERVKTALLAMTAPASGAETAGQPCIEECYDVNGAMAAASVSLTEAGSADKAAAVKAVREAVRAIGISDDAVRLGGQPVVNAELNELVAEACWNPAAEAWDIAHRSPIALSAIVTVVLSFVMLRSFRLATLVQTVSFLTVMGALSIVPLTGGNMNMVLIVMPTLLAVLTTSAAIHLSNYWKHSGIDDPVLSVDTAAKTAWLPCMLAAGTTAIGLLSLVASSLVPVRQFGVYSAIGCGLSFVVVLYLLPSLMLAWPKSPPPAKQLKTEHWRKFGFQLARHRVAVASLCVVLTAAAGWGLRQFKTETKVIRYFPTDSKLYQDYVFLEDKLSGVVSVDTIVKFDEEAQQSLSFFERAQIIHRLQEEIRQHPEVSGVLSLASFLDLRDAKSEDLNLRERLKLNNERRQMEKKIRERLENPDPNDSIISMLAIANEPSDWLEPGDEALNHAGDEVWRVTAQASILSDLDMDVLISDMNRIASSHISLVGSPGSNHVVTGLIPVFLRTQQAVLESLIRSFGMAFGIIAVVMMVLLRNPLAGVITMLPNLMPVILVFGLLSWGQLRVDIGTMITASVALGIAVDGTLHLLTWFQQLVRRGMPQEEAVGRALEHCGPAMWQTSAAIGIGMLALLPAELLLVSRFGWIMAALIFAALLADIVFLPALLGGLLGRLIQNSSGGTSGGEAASSGKASKTGADGESRTFLDPMQPAASTSVSPT